MEPPCALNVREEGRKVGAIIEEVFRVLILSTFGIHGSPGIVVRGTEEKIVGDGFVGHLEKTSGLIELTHFPVPEISESPGLDSIRLAEMGTHLRLKGSESLQDPRQSPRRPVHQNFGFG
jgi:hypothetical protein